jgi:hypothetical protein
VGGARENGFRVTEMTLNGAGSSPAGGRGKRKIRWWLIEAGGGRTFGTEATQTIVRLWRQNSTTSTAIPARWMSRLSRYNRVAR